jgi:hypothetical protein
MGLLLQGGCPVLQPLRLNNNGAANPHIRHAAAAEQSCSLQHTIDSANEQKNCEMHLDPPTTLFAMYTQHSRQHTDSITGGSRHCSNHAAAAAPSI